MNKNNYSSKMWMPMCDKSQVVSGERERVKETSCEFYQRWPYANV